MRPFVISTLKQQLVSTTSIANSILNRSNRLLTQSLTLTSSHSSVKQSYCSQAAQYLPPHVDPEFSYAYGRSTENLSNKTFNEHLDERVKNRPDSLALVSQHEKIQKTNREVHREAHTLAYALYHKLGIRRGDVVCLWGCNSYKWLQVQFACNLLGVILCTVNPAYQGPELLYAIQKAKAKVIFMPGALSPQSQINQFYRIISNPKVSETLKNDSQLKSIVFTDQHDESQLPGFQLIELDQLCQTEEKLNDSILSEVQADDPSLIMYTSGTTGKPKGALLSHFTLINNALLSSTKLQMNEPRVICMPLPLFHAFAYVIGSVMLMVTDSTLVLPGYRYSSKDVIDSINTYKCNVFFGTPTMIIDMMNYVRKNNISTQSLKSMTSGGASMPVEIANQISKAFPTVNDFRIGYGATETGPVSTFLLHDDPVEKKMSTVGRPIDFVELKVVNPNTLRVLPLGQKGELLVRGHNIMLGYLDDEQKTKEAITESRWYRTGDIATMDSEGFVKICGRTKEMIIRGGENVYPLEVEQVLHTHPNILDAYVIGIPDKRVGEEICAWVKLKDPKVQTTEHDIREFCRDKITYFKIPRHVLFVDQFPLTPAGKAKKFVMVEQTCKQLGIETNVNQ